jgi:hypothetical protein
LNVVLLIHCEETPPAGLGEKAQELQGKARLEDLTTRQSIKANIFL